MAIFYVVTTTTFGRYEREFRHREMETRIEKFVNIITSNGNGKGSFEDIKKNFDKYSQIAGFHLEIVNPQGEIIAHSREPGPRPRPSEHIKLQPGDLDTLREGKKISRIMDERGGDHRLMYTVYPIFQRGEFQGGLISMNPVGPPRHFNQMAFNSLLGASIIALVVAFFLSSHFSYPIKKMEQAARSLARGDFSHKINLNRKDELGYLADAFDDMSSRLKKNIENRMKMMGDISHELGTPITTIQVSAEAMYDGLVDTQEGRKNYLKSILNQTRRLTYLISDITELSKFEAGEIRLEETSFFVAEPVRRAVESVEIIVKNNEMTIESEIEDENMKAKGDPERILQAIQNLINNSIQHNAAGTNVKASVSRDNKGVRFSVEDNGRGIPPEEIESIFDRFHKVDKARTIGKSGSGLGLAIVREILESHNSEIKVQPLEKGVRFYFYLPSA